MLDIIKNFLSDLSDTDEPREFLHSKLQLAEAALMYHVIAVDGVVREAEKLKMAEVLAGQFDLDAEQTKSLAKDAITAEHEAIDLYKFTSILKQSLNQEERVNMIENLWEMVFADGVLHELEDNVVWRISELLNVDRRDRMHLKKKVWSRSEVGDEES